MKIIYPELSYVEALELSGLLTLYDRREAIAANLFDEICPNPAISQSPQTTSKQIPAYLLSERTKNIYSSKVLNRKIQEL